MSLDRRQSILGASALALMAGTALLLAAVPQKLGPAGIKASPMPGSERWQIELPEHVLDLKSESREPDAGALAMLPNDTSLAQRIYYKPGAGPFVSGVVLMGTDRTSIHKADYCLRGQGMRIQQITEETIHLDQPRPYDLPVIKIVADTPVSANGQEVTQRCVYVYWYVADGKLSNDRSGFGRMWSMTRQLLFTGVLERWAYVRFYTFCNPGQEDAAYRELKQVIAAAVPQFQLTPRLANPTVAAQH
jgi:hypothetical protein